MTTRRTTPDILGCTARRQRCRPPRLPARSRVARIARCIAVALPIPCRPRRLRAHRQQSAKQRLLGKSNPSPQPPNGLDLSPARRPLVPVRIRDTRGCPDVSSLGLLGGHHSGHAGRLLEEKIGGGGLATAVRPRRDRPKSRPGVTRRWGRGGPNRSCFRCRRLGPDARPGPRCRGPRWPAAGGAVGVECGLAGKDCGRHLPGHHRTATSPGPRTRRDRTNHWRCRPTRPASVS
jgi:hypothetical protein